MHVFFRTISCIEERMYVYTLYVISCNSINHRKRERRKACINIVHMLYPVVYIVHMPTRRQAEAPVTPLPTNPPAEVPVTPLPTNPPAEVPVTPSPTNPPAEVPVTPSPTNPPMMLTKLPMPSKDTSSDSIQEIS